MLTHTFQEIQEEFDKVFLVADRGVLRVINATVIANQFTRDPVWLFLIAASSGGKTEFIESIAKLMISGKQAVWEISDLTVNTFASGQAKPGKETSLLFKPPYGGIFTFKDFTSIIGKNREAKSEIMGQMRGIYDQKYSKRTGTGKDINWNGKVGMIAGCTEVIYETQEELSVMGDRFIMYSMLQPDRMEVLKRVLANDKDPNSNFKQKREHLQDLQKEYIEGVIGQLDGSPIEIDEDTEMAIMEVANFCAIAGSGVVTDFRKGNISFIPSAAMPMRIAKQILSLAAAFVMMNRAEGLVDAQKLTKSDAMILYKIAFDTIPIKRRMALRALATWSQGVSSAGLATSINYQTDVVKGWLAQLNGLGVVDREKKNGPQGDMWFLKEKWQKIMVKYDGVKVQEGALQDQDAEDTTFDSMFNENDEALADTSFNEWDTPS